MPRGQPNQWDLEYVLQLITRRSSVQICPPATNLGFAGRAQAPGLFVFREKNAKEGPEHLKTPITKGGARGTRLPGGQVLKDIQLANVLVHARGKG